MSENQGAEASNVERRNRTSSLSFLEPLASLLHVSLLNFIERGTRLLMILSVICSNNIGALGIFGVPKKIRFNGGLQFTSKCLKNYLLYWDTSI